MNNVTQRTDTRPTPKPISRTLSKTKFLIDGVNDATLKVVQFDNGELGVVRSYNGVNTTLYRSDRLSELRYFAVCQLAFATALDEITEKAFLGDEPRKMGRPKGSTTTPPKGKYGRKHSGVENLTVSRGVQ